MQDTKKDAGLAPEQPSGVKQGKKKFYEKVHTILYFYFLLTGLLFLVTAFGFLLFSIVFQLSSEEHQGTVVEVIRERDREVGGYLYRPRIEFLDSAGHERFFTSSLASYPQLYSVGDQVSVLDNRIITGWARVNNFAELWFSLVFFTGGLVCIVLFWYLPWYLPRLFRFFERT